MLASLATGLFLFLFPNPVFFICLPFFLFFRMALNAIDGMLAREYHQQTTLGAMLNEIGDVISDAALYLPFACLNGVSPELVVLIVWLSGLTEFCGVIHQTLTQQRNYRGPLGKSDRALLFGAAGLFIALVPSFVACLNTVMVAAALLLIRTCYNRCRSAMEYVNV